MPSVRCPPPGLHRGLHPSHKAYRQPVPSNPGLGDALQSTKVILFLVKDRYMFLNAIHEQGLVMARSAIGSITQVVHVPNIWRVPVKRRQKTAPLGLFSVSFPPRPNMWGLVALNAFYGLAPKPFTVSRLAVFSQATYFGSSTSDAEMDFSRSLAGHGSRYIMKG